MTQVSTKVLLIAVLVLAGTAVAVRADPPDRVGRLSYIEGNVSFLTLDTNQWVPAMLNLPVTSGGWFWTDRNSRAEVEIGPVNIYADRGTEIGVLRLDDGVTQLQLGQGVLSLQLQAMPIGGMQIETPQGVVNLLREGRYRLEVWPSGPDPADAEVRLTVLEGEARIDGSGSAAQLRPGEMATVRAGSLNVTGGGPASFDDWAFDHERQEAAAQATQYVSPYMTGYQDLDAYGRWSTEPEYGAVWYPTRVAAGWAPYRYGHWEFVPPWGWTWIDDAPWGFAPFHYGRWAFIHGTWGWCPGERVRHPVYAPALVAFIGGAGWNISITAGQSRPAIGWVPLGPREAFHPYYTASDNYRRKVNRSYVNRTIINNVTSNRVDDRDDVTRYSNFRAATVVPTTAFTRADPVQRNAIALRREQFARARAGSVEQLRPAPAARRETRPAASTRSPEHRNIPAPTQGRDGFRDSVNPARRDERPRRETNANPSQSVSVPAAKPATPGALRVQPSPPVERTRRETPNRARTPAKAASEKEQRRAPITTNVPPAPATSSEPAVAPRPFQSEPSRTMQRPPLSTEPARKSRPPQTMQSPAAQQRALPAKTQRNLRWQRPAAAPPVPSRPAEIRQPAPAQAPPIQSVPLNTSAPTATGDQRNTQDTNRRGTADQKSRTETRKRRQNDQDN